MLFWGLFSFRGRANVGIDTSLFESICSLYRSLRFCVGLRVDIVRIKDIFTQLASTSAQSISLI